MYDDAISSGGTAMLLENDDKDKDSFKLSVGNLAPQKVNSAKKKFLTKAAAANK